MGRISDLQSIGFRLGLVTGFLYGEDIEQWKNSDKYQYLLSYADSTTANTKRLLKGEIDGMLEDPFIISYKLRSQELENQLATLPIKIFGHNSCFMFSKKNINQQLLSKFNQALAVVSQMPEHQSPWIDFEFRRTPE